MELITNQAIDSVRLEAELVDPSCGGVVTFTGKVRNHHQGRQVEKLIYEAFEPMVVQVIQRLLSEAQEKFPIKNIKVVHRVGELKIGEVAVWVGVESAHRGEAFQACEWMINQIKKQAPIWKKEFYVQGEPEWIRCHHE